MQYVAGWWKNFSLRLFLHITKCYYMRNFKFLFLFHPLNLCHFSLKETCNFRLIVNTFLYSWSFKLVDSRHDKCDYVRWNLRENDVCDDKSDMNFLNSKVTTGSVVMKFVSCIKISSMSLTNFLYKKNVNSLSCKKTNTKSPFLNLISMIIFSAKIAKRVLWELPWQHEIIIMQNILMREFPQKST